MIETPAPGASAPTAKPRSPFFRMSLILAAIGVLAAVAGAPWWVALGIPVALFLAMGVAAVVIMRHHGCAAAPASLDDPALQPAAGDFLRAMDRELRALGFGGAALYRMSEPTPYARWWLLAADEDARVGATALVQVRPRGDPILQLSFTTRTANGRRIATLAFNDVPLLGMERDVDAMKLPSVAEVRLVLAVHRRRTRGLATLPVEPVEARIARIVGTEEMVKGGHWRQSADGALRKTLRGAVTAMLWLAFTPVLQWRDRLRERRVLARVAAEPVL